MSLQNVTETAPRLAPGIVERLTAAEARASSLEAQLGDAALDKEIGKSGAATRYTALDRQLADARADVERLRSAHTTAEKRDASTQAEEDHRGRQAQFAAIEDAAKERLEATKAFATAIKQATAAYHRFGRAHANMATLGAPQDTRLPDGAFSPGSEIQPQNLVAREMHRVGGGGTPLPGAKAPSILALNQPEAGKPIVDMISEHNDWILDKLKTDIAALAPPSTTKG